MAVNFYKGDKFMKLFIILVATVCSVSVLAKEKLIFTGEVFDKTGKTKVFTYERYQSVDGDKQVDRAIFKNLSGDTLTEEKVEYNKGEFVRYDMDQKQLKQKAWIEVSAKEVTFNLKKFRKKNYPITEKRKSHFIIGLQVVPIVLKNWDRLMAKESVEVRLGVWHRQESIGFELSQEKVSDGQLVVKMNPTSMFIRAVVNPIYFHFDSKTKDLISYVGRVTPKEKRGRDYYDYDGLVKYKRVP